MNTIKEDYKKISTFCKNKKVLAIILGVLLLVGFIFEWELLVPFIIIGYIVRLWSKHSKEKKYRNIKKTCPHCKEEVNSDATRCPHCHGKIPHFGVGSLLVVVLFTILVIGFVSSSVINSKNPNLSNTSIQQNTPTISPEELAKWKLTPAGKLCEAHKSWRKEECESLIKNEVWVGMSYDMLVYKRGKADSVNPSDYGGGVQYQYCWHDYTPSCFYDHNNDEIMDSYN